MKIWSQNKELLKANWHYGFTSFGGPAVQVQTFHDKFVDDLGWIDEEMFQQIFGLSQALPGSVSIKMLFCINAIHGGIAAGLIACIIFSLPGALGMYGLALGISRIGSTLPNPVYALLSGLNAAAIGIIALAAVRLATRAITDKVTRFLVFLSGVMGTLYTAIWYYPIILVGAGCITLAWDFRYPHSCLAFVKKIAMRWRRTTTTTPSETGEDVENQSSTIGHNNETANDPEKPLPELPPTSCRDSFRGQLPQDPIAPPATLGSPEGSSLPLKSYKADIPKMFWQTGAAMIGGFLATFATTIALSVLVFKTDRAFSLFASLYETGTIVVGGGPVVVPLLETNIVAVGWVTPRDFLLGLAVIQAFPGPNFNFAIYLGALAVSSTPYPSYVGAFLAFVAMYAPGMFIVIGFMGLWRIVQEKRWFVGVLRGVNAAAVGLVFTVVYRLWQIGRLEANGQGVGTGKPLDGDPWLVAITATAYVGGAWFGLSPPVAILLGGAMGMARYGIFGGG